MSNLQEIITDEKIEKRVMPTNIRLNVFKYGWYRWTSWRGFWSNIKNIPRVVKYAWDRATKGYCKADLWDLDTTYLDYILSTLIDFRNNTCSYPNKYKTFEDWIKFLDDCIEDLIYIRTDNDEQNDYNAQYEELLMSAKGYNNYTESEKCLMNLYHTRDEEINIRKRTLVCGVLERLGKNFYDLWW